MSIIEIAKIQVRRGQENQTGIPQLDPGEFGWAEDTEHLYIGKRIVEGANSDENSRILTENDYDNLFAIASGRGTSVASTSTYRYRNDVNYNALHSTTTTIAYKLDTTVNLVDFGVVTSSTAVDITVNFQKAIVDLFKNPTMGADTRRRLIIPAGTYLLSSTTQLPPYTTLIGEGMGMTTLISTTGTAMFKTIDASGNNFESGSMQTATLESKQVTIQGMTLSYVNTSIARTALLSLDNTSNARIDNVRFTAQNAELLSNYGTGISIRGTRLPGVNQTIMARNITVENCQFDSIGTAIIGNGSVINSTIENNSFNNLYKGITLTTATFNNELIGPNNFIIFNNKFDNIVQSGLVAETSTNRANHVSENNIYNQVGNGVGLNDNITVAASPVIGFYAQGCRSINDQFSRAEFAVGASGSFYYNPLVAGVAFIDNTSIVNKNITNGVSSIFKVPLTNEDQMVTLRYELFDNNYSRKGNMLINITKDNDGSVSDYYNYSYVNSVIDPIVSINTTNVSLGYITVDISSGFPYNIFYQTTIIS
jgi:hypothetical protein